MNDHNSKFKMIVGNLCILFATIFWGVNVAFTKALIPNWMTSEGISAVRLIGGCSLFWIVSLFVKTDKVARSDWKQMIAGGVIGLFGFIWLFVLSLKYANPIDVSIIMTLPPMFVLVIDILFLKTRPHWLEYVGMVVSFAGAIIVILGGSQGHNGSDNVLGDLLAVGSCLCYALYLVFTVGLSRRYRPITMLRWLFLFAAIPGLFFLKGFDVQPILHTHNFAPWGEIGFILLFPTFIAYFLVHPAINDIGSERVSLYQYLLPVFATISAVVMGLDHLKWIQVLAMVIIVAGMVLTDIGKRHRKSAPEKQASVVAPKSSEK